MESCEPPAALNVLPWPVVSPKNRVGGSAAFSFVFAFQYIGETVDTPAENGGCGYDFASGVHKYLYVSDDPVDFTDPTGHAHYEWDPTGYFHVHSNDRQGKLTYSVRARADGTVVLVPKPKHESEFSLERATADWAKNSRDPDELKKMRDVVRDAWPKYNDKGPLRQTGRALRRLGRAGAVISSLYVISWGLSLDPGNSDAVLSLHGSMSKIQRDWNNHTPLNDDDINDAMVAIHDIYGNDDFALWYWNELEKLEENQSMNNLINSGPTSAGFDIGAGGVDEITPF